MGLRSNCSRASLSLIKVDGQQDSPSRGVFQLPMLRGVRICQSNAAIPSLRMNRGLGEFHCERWDHSRGEMK